MIIAKAKFFSSEQGGRYSPPSSGYKPQIDIEGLHTSCTIHSLSKENIFSFNIEYDVKLDFMFFDEIKEKIILKEYALYEGNKCVGKVKITSLS